MKSMKSKVIVSSELNLPLQISLNGVPLIKIFLLDLISAIISVLLKESEVLCSSSTIKRSKLIVVNS